MLIQVRIALPLNKERKTDPMKNLLCTLLLLPCFLHAESLLPPPSGEVILEVIGDLKLSNT
ncbi:hypothetical protein A3743_22395 [Oleiphilus sp. HI0072]|nr:hypothetical protein A3743_22395 [Oleiphilus sp. HI0072]